MDSPNGRMATATGPNAVHTPPGPAPASGKWWMLGILLGILVLVLWSANRPTTAAPDKAIPDKIVTVPVERVVERVVEKPVQVVQPAPVIINNNVVHVPDTRYVTVEKTVYVPEVRYVTVERTRTVHVVHRPPVSQECEDERIVHEATVRQWQRMMGKRP